MEGVLLWIYWNPCRPSAQGVANSASLFKDFENIIIIIRPKPLSAGRAMRDALTCGYAVGSSARARLGVGNNIQGVCEVIITAV